MDAPGGRYLWFGYDYYHPDRLIVVGDNAGRAGHFGYDAQGRLATATDPRGGVATYTYDAAAWLITRKTDTTGNPVFSNTYDADGRAIQQVNSQGQNLTLSYQVIIDTEGLVDPVEGMPVLTSTLVLRTIVQDATGARTTYEYGADGLLRRVTDPTGAQTRYRSYSVTRQPGTRCASPTTACHARSRCATPRTSGCATPTTPPAT